MIEVPIALRWVILLALIAAIVVLSVTPGDARPEDNAFNWLVVTTPVPVQKLMHFVVYAGLAAIWAWTLEGVGSRWMRVGIAFALSVALGIALEWYQTRVPGRFGALTDVLLNTAGALAGLLLAMSLF